jgi:hypothetical protein
LPSLSNSSTRILRAGMVVYTLGDVHNPLHFTTYSCYGENRKIKKVLKSRKQEIIDKLQIIYNYKLHKNLE